jgi:hypothetical protein
MHPIPSVYTQITGENSPSKGLSAGFSEIVRGNLKMAQSINPNAIRVFSFFLMQLALRIIISIVVFCGNNKTLWVAAIDSAISIFLFVYCFAPLIEFTFKKLTSLF